MRIVATLFLDLILNDDPEPEHPNLAVEFVLPFALNVSAGTAFRVGSWQVQVGTQKLQTSAAVPKSLLGNTIVVLRRQLAREPSVEFTSKDGQMLISSALEDLNMLLRAWSVFQPATTARSVMLADLPFQAVLELKEAKDGQIRLIAIHTSDGRIGTRVGVVTDEVAEQIRVEAERILQGNEFAVARAVRADAEARLLGGDYFTGVVLMQTFIEMLVKGLLNALISAGAARSGARDGDFDGQRRAVCRALHMREDDPLLQQWRRDCYWVRGRGLHKATMAVSDEQANRAYRAANELAADLVKKASELGISYW